MVLSLHAQGYRGLADIRWPVPPGLSVVVGANGAGKTTLLFLFELVRHIATQHGGTGQAIEAFGGTRALKHFGREEDRVTVGAAWGELDWQIDLVPQAGGIADYPAERLTSASLNIYSRQAATPTFSWEGAEIATDARSILRQLSEADLHSGFVGRPLIEALERCRMYYDYDIAALRHGSERLRQVRLGQDGRNAFSVLRNWSDRPSLHGRKMEFVRETLREIFGFFGGFEFEEGANIIEVLVLHRKYGRTFPAGAAAQGWLVALLHLIAVAGSERGAVIGLDDFEYALHPRAVVGLLDALSEYAEAQGISVLITSQSPQVLEWFDAHPEKVYVLDPRRLPGPVPLTTLRSEEWLAHFRLGRKFADGDFAGEGPE